MRLSVIIPTHERPAALQRTLGALAEQSLEADSFEVIVVDDGSAESTRVRLRELQASHRFQLLEQPNGGLASARNAGAERAQGAVLLFLDDDVVPGHDSLAQHVRIHEQESGPLAVVGSLPFPESIARDSFLWYLDRSGHFDLYQNPHKYPAGRPPMPPLNGNSSVSRRTFADVGGYDDSFRQYGGEDLEMGYRLAAAGVRFVYCPEAVGWHHHGKSFDEFCRDQERAGESLIQLYRKYPEIKVPKKIDLLVDPPSALPPSRRLQRLVMNLTLASPWLMTLGRWKIRLFGGIYLLRGAMYPLYRWLGHAHYAIGMRRALGGGAD